MKKLLYLAAVIFLALIFKFSTAGTFIIQYNNANPNDSVMYSSASLSGKLYTGGGVQYSDGSTQTSASNISPSTLTVTALTVNGISTLDSGNIKTDGIGDLVVSTNISAGGYIVSAGSMTVGGSAFSVGGSTFSVSAGGIYPGITLSTQTAGGAGAAVTVTCPSGKYAYSGGCSCVLGAAANQEINMPAVNGSTMTAAGAMPNGWYCEMSGTTGGQCAAFVICSALRF